MQVDGIGFDSLLCLLIFILFFVLDKQGHFLFRIWFAERKYLFCCLSFREPTLLQIFLTGLIIFVWGLSVSLVSCVQQVMVWVWLRCRSTHHRALNADVSCALLCHEEKNLLIFIIIMFVLVSVL